MSCKTESYRYFTHFVLITAWFWLENQKLNIRIGSASASVSAAGSCKEMEYYGLNVSKCVIEWGSNINAVIKLTAAPQKWRFLHTFNIVSWAMRTLFFRAPRKSRTHKRYGGYVSDLLVKYTYLLLLAKRFSKLTRIKMFEIGWWHKSLCLPTREKYFIETSLAIFCHE